MTSEQLVRQALLVRERLVHAIARTRHRSRRQALLARSSGEVARFPRLRDELAPRWSAVRGLNEPAFTTPAWQGFVDALAERLIPDLPFGFLGDPLVSHTMVFTRGGKLRATELEVVSRVFGSQRMPSLLGENAVGDPPLADAGAGITSSPNTIHHAYHFARFTQATGVDWGSIDRVVEWGGGYGNQAKLVRRLAGDNVGYTIVDLPLFSLIQWLYLSSVLGEDAVTLLDAPGETCQPGKITLVPVGLVRDTPLEADLLVSTWALSESARPAQEHVLERDWFGAGRLLLAHQRSSPDFPAAGRLGELAVAAGGRSEPVTVLPGNNYVFR